MNTEDTITAIATPIGSGGISVIRISGSEALKIASAIFKGKHNLFSAKSHTLHFGMIVDPDREAEPVDEAVFAIYKAPHSYTGEDVVEISCHGGIYLTQKVLELTLRKGARLAEPGEFTKRAFLNGRIDLSQAEAVADLVRARSDLSLKSSLAQLMGELSSKVKCLRDALVEVCSLLELELDFSEEDVSFVEREEIIKKVEGVLKELDLLISSYRRGRFLQEGVKLAIVGRPNVGKSSLLNALLGRERAIVDEVPGTTRDSLEEALELKGLLFKVIDTAGLRRVQMPVERKGVERTERHMEEADLILLVVDGSEELTAEDEEILRRTRSLIGDSEGNRQVIVAVNKIDLRQKIELQRLQELVGLDSFHRISAKQGWGLEELEKALVEVILEGEMPGTEGTLVTNLRHQQALIKAKGYLQLAKESLIKGMSPEFVVVDLRGSLDCLGEIVGITTSQEILDEIFSKFCIGK